MAQSHRQGLEYRASVSSRGAIERAGSGREARLLLDRSRCLLEGRQDEEQEEMEEEGEEEEEEEEGE